MLANYNRAANNVQKGKENVASRATNAYKRLKDAVERQKSGKMNSNKNAQNAVEDDIDMAVQNDLKEKTKEMRGHFDAATKKAVDDYFDDMKEEARDLAKDKDPHIAEKLKNALIKIIADGDMSSPEPKVKRILVFIIPLFLLAAPYISKIFRKFKYSPGDEAYERLAAFVDAMKEKQDGGENEYVINKSPSPLWSVNFYSSWSMINFGMAGAGPESLPVLLPILMVIAFYFALIITVTAGLFVFDALAMVKNAIVNKVKEAHAAGKASRDLQRAAPELAYAVVQHNPLHRSK
jgi:hypothetical protein